MTGKDSALAVLAVLVFVPLFVLRAIGPLDFWWGMTGAIVLVGGLAVVLDKSYGAVLAGDAAHHTATKILLGALTAVLLYLVFLGLNALSRLVFPMAASEIRRVYALKSHASAARVALLILFPIGPGEEIIWRGFFQRHWEKRWGFPRGWLLAAVLYTAVHLGSGNTMLVLAAAAAGLFWGFLYHRFHSVLLNAVSHTLWDILIFLLLPVSA
jgi:membrane protease YdiL (CAAX protease family)